MRINIHSIPILVLAIGIDHKPYKCKNSNFKSQNYYYLKYPILQYIEKSLSIKVVLTKNSNLKSQIIRDNIYSIGP